MIATLALFLALAPGDAVSLAPPEAQAPSLSPAAPISAPPAPSSSLPAAPALAAGALGGLTMLAVRRRYGGAAAPQPSPDPLVVFVSGHGNASPPGVFAYLMEKMGTDPQDARFFDYRWADGGTDHASASEDSSIDDTADSLNSYLAGLADGGRPLYLVGFSKGGAGIAELVARWDRGDPGPAASVEGATLLDPPMASGVHGFLQSLGSHWGAIPDDGGYDPVDCSPFSCTDSRADLGEASGVEVMVVRNPQAGITNFADVPEGLRVYEASDGGPGFWRTLFTRPWDLPHRVAEAHESVLFDPRVADCIRSEITHSGTCSLPRVGDAPPAGLIVHGTGSGAGVNKMC